MGTAIVGGMVTSTALTLVVIPVVYSVLDDLGAWIRGLFSAKGRLARRRRAGDALGEQLDGEPAETSSIPLPAGAASATADDTPEEAAVSR
jgi:HAE1 family hydrophobic/amphiphilic exporter-1